MEIIYLILGIVGVIVLFWLYFEITTLLSYGCPINDEEILEAIEMNHKKGIKINKHKNTLCIGDLPEIFLNDESLLFPYLIKNVGTVYRFSKSYWIIYGIFEENKKIKSLIKNEKTRTRRRFSSRKGLPI